MDNPAALRFGPAPWVRGAIGAGALAAVAWGLLDTNPEDRLVAAVIAIACVTVTALLLRVRLRLVADTAGLTVIGPLHRRRIPWASVASLVAVRRGRFGRRGATIEVEVMERYDAGARPADAELLTFSAFELGGDPAAICPQLAALRARAAGS